MMEPELRSSVAGDMAARTKTLYEALEALPEGVTGEILHGQLYAQPRPRAAHALAASNLGAELIGPYARGRNGPGGWWIIDEPELHFMRDVQILVPDLAGWRRERMPELPADHRFEVAPDWICEVLSPATRSKDREIKMPLYAANGVLHAWLIDPDARTLEAYALRNGAWTRLATYAGARTVTAEPFPAAAFPVDDLLR